MGNHIGIGAEGKIVDKPQGCVAQHDAPHSAGVSLDDGKRKQHGTGANHNVGPALVYNAGASDVG